jgi:hypothetical protein
MLTINRRALVTGAAALVPAPASTKTATMKPKTGVDLARKDLGKLPLGTRQGSDEASGRDGRPDTGKCDRLLERLMKVHGEMRNELFRKKK